MATQSKEMPSDFRIVPVITTVGNEARAVTRRDDPVEATLHYGDPKESEAIDWLLGQLIQ